MKTMHDRGPVPLLTFGFRPFFLLAGVFAFVAMALWAAALGGHGPALGPLWHGHELLFGYGGAVVAGFILTAASRWTGRTTLTGAPLAALVLLWAAGRLVAALPGVPGGLAAAVTAGFFVVLGIGVARPIVAARSRRNYGILAVLAAFAGLELLYWLVPGERSRTLLSALLFMLVLVAVIGGRILPLFTRNATPGLVVRPGRQVRDVVALAALAGLAVMVLCPDDPRWLAGTLACAGALAHAARLKGWGGSTTFGRPLLAVLHAAYACIPAGLALFAARAFGAALPPWVALHVLALGGFGLMTLGMMTRVTLGHTGRPLRADPGTTVAYVLLVVALIVRAVSPFLGAVPAYHALLASAGLWSAAFLLFVLVYAPRLVRPRVDGRPG